VANHDNDYRYPEDLLVGADRPRQLPLAVRERLEDALTDQRSRPLSPEVRGRLESSLRPRRARRKWTVMAPGLVAAALIVVVAGVVVPGLLHKSPASTGVNDVALPAQHRPLVPGAARSSAPSFGRSTGTAAKTGQHSLSAAAGVAALRAGANPRVPVPPFVMVPPAVDEVHPRSGPPTGATWVVVTGSGLGGVTEVHFGSVAAERFDVVSTHEIRALSPVHAPGMVDIVVSGQIRKSPVSSADRYMFTR
jgi:hypothetical protein